MSSTLSTLINIPAYQNIAVAAKVSKVIVDNVSTNAGFQALKGRVEIEGGIDKSYFWLVVVVVSLHIAVVIAYINRDTTSVVLPQKHEVMIEFVRPEIVPPPPIEPPKPPQPKVEKVTPPPPKAAPALRTPPAEQNIAPSDITVAENTEATKSDGPVVAAPGPAEPDVTAAPAPVPPAPKAEEPVTEATANAAYLNNPKPDYPAAAARQGWGGTVTLRVRVLADGHPESVTIKKSSGRKVLDEAAIAAVQKWTFVPSKRGSTPIDGWATVPVIFNPEQ